MEILARIMMSKNFSVGRTLIMLYGVVSMTGPGVYAEEAREALSLRRFEDCQEEYCDRLVEKLNEPIEWRLVLDVSGSFGDSPQANLEKARTVVRQLPLADGDSLCLDFFGLDYWEGACRTLDEERKRSLKGPYGFLNVLIQEAKKVQGETRDLTDIPAVVNALVGRDCSEERCYYVFLTDGMYEPEGFRGKPQPLFTGGSEGFLQQIVEFIKPSPTADDGDSFQLVRGLRFVIDVSPARQASQDARDRRGGRDARPRSMVAEDWLAGADKLGELERARKPGRRAFYPAIHVTTFEGTDPSFTDEIRKEVDRWDGVYACLLSTSSGDPDSREGRENSGWKWPTVHGGLYPGVADASEGCPAWPDETYKVLLPGALLASGDSEGTLPIQLLTYGSPSKAPSLVAKFTSARETAASASPNEEDVDRVETLKEYPLDPPPSANWRRYRVSVSLGLTRDRVQGQLSPVRATFRLGRASRSPAFLDIAIHGQGLGWAPSDFMAVRGRAALLVTLLFMIASFVFLVLSARTDATLRLEPHRESGSKDTESGDQSEESNSPHSIRSPLSPSGLRMEIDSHGNEIPGEEIRSPGAPSFDDNNKNHFFLDIIPFGFLVYILVWRSRGKTHPIPTDAFALDVNDERALAKLVHPLTTWVCVPAVIDPGDAGEPVGSEPNAGIATTNQHERWKKFCSTFCGLHLKWGKSLEIETEDEGTLKYNIFLKLEPLSRTFRTLGLLFHIVAVSGACVAIDQFLGPDGWVSWKSTQRHLLLIALILFLGRLSLHTLPVMMQYFPVLQKPRILTLLFFINRFYVAAFGLMLCSAATLAWVDASQSFTWTLVVLLAVTFGTIVFITPYWVRKRLSESKSLYLPDVVFDTFLSYGPLAT